MQISCVVIVICFIHVYDGKFVMGVYYSKNSLYLDFICCINHILLKVLSQLLYNMVYACVRELKCEK